MLVKYISVQMYNVYHMHEVHSAIEHLIQRYDILQVKYLGATCIGLVIIIIIRGLTVFFGIIETVNP